MLGRCQSTRIGKKKKSINSSQTGLTAWLPLCVWHKLPCEERRLLLLLCHTTAANQGPDMLEVWAHHHLWLAWIGTDLRSPAVWLAGTKVSGKCTFSLPFHSCSAGDVFLCMCVCTYSVCLFVCMQDIVKLQATVHVCVCVSVCLLTSPSLSYDVQAQMTSPNMVQWWKNWGQLSCQYSWEMSHTNITVVMMYYMKTN